MAQHGSVKWFDLRKGYGFITGDDGVDTFVHHNGIEKGRRYTGFETGDEVTYEIGQGEKGQQAEKVVLVKAVENPNAAKKSEVNTDEAAE